jgi:transposase
MADLPASLRRLAVQRVDEGYSQAEVAEFLGVSTRSIRRWIVADRDGGARALMTKARCGRPPKLTEEQVTRVLSWLRDASPCDFGFPTERWTAPRVASLIERQFGVPMNHRYLNRWLRRHGVSPQVPERVPRERDEPAVRRWVTHVWPWIKKKPAGAARTWFLPTRAGF